MDVMEKLRELTGHKYVQLTESGNSAIFAALHMAKANNHQNVLIPDQGGWLTYKTFPKRLGLDLVEVKTNYGLLDLDDLRKKVDKHSVLIIAALGGYIVEQSLDKISQICKEKDCMLIVDISGSIGMDDYSNANMLVCSFGRWKPANLGYGGFISSNKKFLEIELLKKYEFDDKKLEALNKKIDGLDQRMRFLRKTCEEVKKELKDYNIVHPNGNGLVVVVKFGNEVEKQKLIKYCKENNFEYTLCPRYIRILDDAISIEVKRLG